MKTPLGLVWRAGRAALETWPLGQARPALPARPARPAPASDPMPLARSVNLKLLKLSAEGSYRDRQAERLAARAWELRSVMAEIIRPRQVEPIRVEEALNRDQRRRGWVGS